MELIDIGVNLTNKRLYNDVDDILNQAAEAGVKKMIVTGTSVEHSTMAVDLCERYPEQLYCTCGVHPHDAKTWNHAARQQIEQLLDHSCVRAIGETGLDFNRMYSPREQQIDAFQQQMDLAIECDLPLFLHQRDAFDTFHSLLREYRHQLNQIVVHCFTDSKKSLYQLLDLDCHIGITGWICDERRGLELQALVRDIPPNRLMLETDAPYLLPRDLADPPADKTNRPEYLPHILKTVARHQGKPPGLLAEQVLQTTEVFFGM